LETIKFFIDIAIPESVERGAWSVERGAWSVERGAKREKRRMIRLHYITAWQESEKGGAWSEKLKAQWRRVALRSFYHGAAKRRRWV